jgi:hypothetical protein
MREGTMRLTGRKWLTAGVWLGCLTWMAVVVGMAQGVSTTLVQGTVYLANGQTGSGTLWLSWPAFTTANGQAITAGSLSVPVGTGGLVSVSLTPNQGATPEGLFYTAVYDMNDGSTNTEYWVVPVGTQASLAQVRAQVMPATQAVQAVSKAYVDAAIESLEAGTLTPVGGTLTGPLYLNGDPTQALQAADKRYVDASVDAALPLAGGAATGPLTALQLGAEYEADQFAGADAGAQVNACVAAVIAAGGGTCDARALGGARVIHEEIDLGSEAQAASGTVSVALLLPVSAVWEFNITDGTSCGIKQFSNNSLTGESSTGGAVRMILAPYDTTTNMDSLYCTDPNPTGSGGGNYVRARGFAAFASYGGTGTGTFANGAVHVQHMFDESSFSYIMAGGTPLAPYGWQIDDTCCGDSFDHVQGLMRIGKEDIVTGALTTAGSALVTYSGTTARSASALIGKTVLSFDNQNPATGANAANETIAAGTTVTAATATTLTLSHAAANTTMGNLLEIDPEASGGASRGGATTSTFMDVTANDPPAGMPNVLIGGGSTALDFTNLYVEQDGDPDNTTPMVYVGSKTDGVFLHGMNCADNGETMKPCVYGTSPSWGTDALTGHGGIVDKFYGVTVRADNGGETAPYQANAALTKAVFTPSTTGWYRVLDTSRLFQQPAVLAGTLEVSQFQGADALWDFAEGTYGQHSSLSVRRALYQYGSWGSVTKIEVSKNGLNQYVDVYVSSTSQFPVTVMFSGMSLPSGAIVPVPVVGATPPNDGNAALIDLTQLPQSTPRATTETQVAVGSPVLAASADGSNGVEMYANNNQGGGYVQQTGGGSLWINNPYVATFVQTGGYQNVVFNNNGKTQFNYNVGLGGNGSAAWMLSGSANNWGVDTNGTTHRAGSSPAANAGTVTGTNEGGFVSGLTAATAVTLTFANGGWSSWASCEASASGSLNAAPYVSTISNASVTFMFPSMSGRLYYHCDGN